MVTIRIYHDIGEASLERSFLEAQGIPAVLEEDASGIVGMVDGHRLQVPESDVERARQLLHLKEEDPLVAEIDETPVPERVVLVGVDSDASLLMGFIKGGSYACGAIAAFLWLVFNPGTFFLAFFFGGVVGLLVSNAYAKGKRVGETQSDSGEDGRPTNSDYRSAAELP